MEGVTGTVQCDLGGLIRIQTIDANGEVVTIQTPGHCNPEQKV